MLPYSPERILDLLNLVIDLVKKNYLIIFINLDMVRKLVLI